MVTVTPIDGWGFMETVDGTLAPAFGVHIDETGVNVGGGGRGWRGSVDDHRSRYVDLPFAMSPRHTTWTGTVVINIRSGASYAFSGMAETSDLECNWL